MNEFETAELQRLRAVRSGETEMDADTLAMGRARLERQIDERTRKTLPAAKTRRTPRWLPKLALAGVAAVAVVGIGTATFGPGPTAPKAQAAVTFEKAAAQLRAQETVLEEGQLLRTEERIETLRTLPWEEIDPSRDGVVLYRDIEGTVRYGDPGGGGTLQSMGWKFAGVVPSSDSETEQLVRAAAEKFQANQPSGLKLESYRGASFETLEGLRAEMKNRLGPAAAEEPEEAYKWLFPIVSNPGLSPDTRAAAFDLLAEMQPADGTQPKRTSASSSIPVETGSVLVIQKVSGTSSQHLIFDEQGNLKESREVLDVPSDKYPGVEPGTVISSVTISTSIVDSRLGPDDEIL